MQFLNLFKKKKEAKRTRQQFGSDIVDFIKGYAASDFGTHKASNISAVYACITAICESIAMTPAQVVEYEGDRIVVRDDHPIATILDHHAKSYMDSFIFKETCQGHILEDGSSYSYIVKNRVGEIVELLPLQPDLMEVKQSGSEILYHYKDDINNEPKIYTKDEILHIRNRSKDGIKGRSPLVAAKRTVSFAHHLLEHGTNLFANGAFMSGFLSTDFEFQTDEQRAEFVESFKKILGSQNAGKVGLLEKGATYEANKMNAKDSQFIESKQFSVLEIARIFRMPPHMIQDLAAGASYASIEQQSINFVQYTIKTWATRWEYALTHQLFSEKEKDFAIRFDTNALVKGDLKSMTEAIVSQLKYGLSTINEGREELGKNPTQNPVGNDIFVDQNMRTAGDYDDENAKPADNDIEELARSAFERIRNRELAFFKSKASKEESRVRDFFKNHPQFLTDQLGAIARIAGKELRLQQFIPKYCESLEAVTKQKESAEKNLLPDVTAELSVFMGA